MSLLSFLQTRFHHHVRVSRQSVRFHPTGFHLSATRALSVLPSLLLAGLCGQTVYVTARFQHIPSLVGIRTPDEAESDLRDML